MMKRSLSAFVVVSALLALASRADAAPIDIILRLDAVQNGPLYSWTISLDVQEGYTVGAINVLTTGLDSFTLNTANPDISPPDSVYTIDPLGDGRNALLVNNTAIGVSFATGPITGSLLGTFTSTSLQGVGVFGFEEIESPSVFDAFGNGLPVSDFSIRIEANPPPAAIPEPRHLGYASMLIAAITIVLASRKRAAVSR